MYELLAAIQKSRPDVTLEALVRGTANPERARPPP